MNPLYTNTVSSFSKIVLISLINSLLISEAAAQPNPAEVRLVGAMRDVMWKGELQGKLLLDTITSKKHLYGLGPVEYLAGEILIWDGKAYQSSVLTDSTMTVSEGYDIKAPFFAYANIARWTEQQLPDSVLTLAQLEAYLNEISKTFPRPFFFKLAGAVSDATIHVVNLPPGSSVSSPAEAHQGMTKYRLAQEQVQILGFFSTSHKSIFTHHDTYLHMHLITADRARMGHLDEANFAKGKMTLYLPAFR